jgi:hypothetical protein
MLHMQALKGLMMARGEGFTSDEASAMLAAAMDDSGRVYYEDFAATLANDGRKL